MVEALESGAIAVAATSLATDSRPEKAVSAWTLAFDAPYAVLLGRSRSAGSSQAEHS